MQPSSDHWFRNAVLYQIYPRSFYDSNSDGVGDLRGVTQRLRYLNGDDDSLGIDAIWLSPIYPSPMKDFGYDVSDHCDIDPLFGNMDDFTQLLTEAHKRSIKVFIDYIPNHTSDQHEWFKESKRTKLDPRRNWYTWCDAGTNGGPPNNWLSVFGGSAWEFDETTGQYYLHSYLKEQPDLNWENAGVREAMRQVMRFWLDLGVDGFRVDAVSSISKDLHMRDDPINKNFTPDQIPYEKHVHIYSKEGPRLYDYMEVMAKVLRSYSDRFMIFEASPAQINKGATFLGLYEHVDPSVSASFNFEGIHSAWNADKFKKFIDTFQAGMHPVFVPIYCFGNHDQPRIASRIGKEAARAAAVMQFSLPGMPVIYNGEEIGMHNVVISPEDVQDPFEKNIPGKGFGRDPERTPMQWNSNENAGFTKSKKPWLPISPDYLLTNVDAEQLNPHSFLNLYKQMLKLRKSYPALQHGSYESFEVQEDILCFIRTLDKQRIMTFINFSDQKAQYNAPFIAGTIIFSSISGVLDKEAKIIVSLLPNEAVLVVLR